MLLWFVTLAYLSHRYRIPLLKRKYRQLRRSYCYFTRQGATITKNRPATGSLLSFYIYYRIYMLYIINKYVRIVCATLASSGKIRCTVRLETEARLFLYPAMCFCSALSKEQPRFFNHPFHPCWLSSFTLNTSLVLSLSLYFSLCIFLLYVNSYLRC